MADNTGSLDLSALSPKQQDMAKARSPMAGQEQNQLNMERTAQNRQLDEQRKGIATRQQAERKNLISPSGQGGISGGQAAGQMQRNLSSFSNRVAAKMNQFLSGGDTSQLALDLPSEAKPYWDEATKSWKVPELGEDIYDVGAIAGQKAQQAAALKDEFSPYMEYTDIGGQTVARAKSFEDVLSQFADTNNDGVIDQQEQKYLDEAFQIAQMIQRLEKINPRSAEAAALRDQLEMADDKGLVSGIYRALDQYERVTGEEGKGVTMYGGLGQEDLNLENIINLSTGKMEQELLKALTGQESFFTGDFESELTSNRLRTQAERNLAFDAQTRTAISGAAEDWASTTSDTFDNYREKINTGFLNAVEKIPAVFDTIRADMEARGEDTAPLDAALQWFDDISSGEQDPATAIYELLSDPENGLAVNQRKMIADWIGQATGDNTATQAGLLAGILNSISQTGTINTQIENDKGEMEDVVVEFSDKDRIKIAQILGNDALSSEQKTSAINQLVQTKIGEHISSIGDVNKIKEYVDEGSFEAGLDAFVMSLVQSLNTFNKSATEHFYNEVMKDRGTEFTEGMEEGGDARDFTDPAMIESVQAAAQDLADQASENLKNIVNRVLPSVEESITKAENDIRELNATSQKLYASRYSAIQSTKSELMRSLTETGLDYNVQMLTTALSRRMLQNGQNPENVDWGLLDSYFKAYTLYKNLGWMAEQGDDATKAAIKNSSVYKRNLHIIENPLQWFKDNYPITAEGTLAQWAPQMGRIAFHYLDKDADKIATETFESSDFAKAVNAKRKSIDDALVAANTHINEARNFEARVRGYIDNAGKAIEDMRIFNPDEVAQMALKMGKAAERGFTDVGDFIDLSKYNLSKEDFERVSSGEMDLRPLYSGSAVQDLDADYKYRTLIRPEEDTELRSYADVPLTPEQEEYPTLTITKKPDYITTPDELVRGLGDKARGPTYGSPGFGPGTTLTPSTEATQDADRDRQAALNLNAATSDIEKSFLSNPNPQTAEALKKHAMSVGGAAVIGSPEATEYQRLVDLIKKLGY